MGSKNRQGCCCGGSSIKCLNGCDICEGAFLKNGVVTDDLGEHSFKQPKDPDASSIWTTDWIEWTTDDFTDGDCARKTGKAFYRYELACLSNILTSDPNHGGMAISVLYSTVECPLGVTLFDGAKNASGPTDGVSIPHQDVTCNPITASFAMTQQFGLSVPWLNPTVTFDRDAAGENKCLCRSCGEKSSMFPGSLPYGDVILSYDIKAGIVDPRTGSLTLTKVDDPDPFAACPVMWVGNVDWWDQPSCANPTNAPGGYNVVLRTMGLDFLMWCRVNLGTPFTNQLPSNIGDDRFDLLDADGVKQGSLRIKDAPDSGLGDNICCYPCRLPKKDLSITSVTTRTRIFPPAPPVSTTDYSTTLKYSEPLWEMPNGHFRPGSTPLSHWRSEPINLSPEASIKYAIYFNCHWDYTPFDLTPTTFVYGGSSPEFPYGSIDGDGPFNWPTGLGYFPLGKGSICSPLHIVYESDPVTGPAPGGVYTSVTRVYLDEIE